VVIGGAVAAAAAVAGIGVAAFNAGMQLDDAYDKIAVGTGATGEVLAGLQDDFKAVFKTVPADAETVSGAITELNSRLGATGQPLQDMAKGLSLSAKLMGGDATQNAATLAKMMGSWGLSNEQGAATLDKLFVATQKSGISLEQLTGSVQQYGPALRAMGFGLDESIALMGNFEKAGIESGQVMAGMKLAAGKFAKAGIDVKTGFMGAIDSIKNAKTSTAALSEGMELFGARAAPAMVDAIRSGKFALEDMVAALQDSEGAIESTSKATEDWPEKWAKLKNVATVALAPIGTALMDIAGKILDKAGPALETLAGIIEKDVVPFIENVVLAIETMVAGDWDAPWEELFPPWIADTIKTVISTVQGLIPAFQEAFAFISANATPILAGLAAMLLTVLVPAFWAWAAAAAATAIANLPLIALVVAIGAAVALLTAAWINDWGGIRTTLTEFWTNTAQPIFEALKAWLEVNIPKAIATVSGVWTGTLVPAFQAVSGFITGTLLPVFSTVAGWLSDKIPAAAGATASFWSNTLLPAIRSVWDFLSGSIVNIFGTVRDWLQTNLPTATRALSSLWTGTLLPAITAVWDFLDQYIIPIFTTLVEVDIALLNLALQALAGFWENTLKPALETVWKFINDNVIPIFESLTADGIDATKAASSALSSFWSDTLQPALKKVSDFLNATVVPVFKDVAGYIEDNFGPAVQWLADAVFGGLKIAIDGIKGILNWFYDKLKALKDLIASIKLPDFLNPGSPTPLELGIIGINAALKEMNSLLGDTAGQPLMRMGAVMPMMPSQPSLGGMPLGERVMVEVNGNGGGSTTGNTYNLAVTYKETESESDLYHTVRMLQLMEI
jgi:TP901 family phage tail tape measure protein